MKVDDEIGSHVLVSDNGPICVISVGEEWRFPEAKSVLGDEEFLSPVRVQV